MERPHKRPRLSMFANMDPDPELDQARSRNDMLLKTRFEAIFAKYSQDFEGVGDIVDLNTGHIEQDNGHLHGMESEKDTGQSRSKSPKPKIKPNKHANGQSLLRAMTVAPARDDSYFDDEDAGDVIQSIEEIAENAAVSDDEEAVSDEESDDDLFSVRPQRTFMDEDTPYSSDDSMFDVVDPVIKIEEQEDSRFSSPDSLFQGETPPSAAQQNADYEPHRYHQLDGAAGSQAPEDEFNERAIYAKFGSRIGKEVMQLLEKRDNAELHIDPAWRIPANVKPQRSTSASTVDTISEKSASPDEVPFIHNTSPNKGSLWDVDPPRLGRRPAMLRRGVRSVSEESEDPLQEGFHSDSGDEEVEFERCLKVAKNGMCPYCQGLYVDKMGVLQHLNREAKFVRAGQDRGEHYNNHIFEFIEYVHKRGKERVVGKTNGPRLLMCDFKTLVELHEGADMTFHEIILSETLWTMKNDATMLQQLYDKYRDIENVDGIDGKPSKEWSRTENKLLKQLTANPKNSMDIFRRKLSKRTRIEIGNKLADMWLTELHQGKMPYHDEESEVEIKPKSKSQSKKRERPDSEDDCSDDGSDPEYMQSSRTRRKRPKQRNPEADFSADNLDSDTEVVIPKRPSARKGQPRQRSRKEDGDNDADDAATADMPYGIFANGFKAQQATTPMPERVHGLPPMPQSVVRSNETIDWSAWGVDNAVEQADDLAQESDDDLFVPNMWA